MKNQIKKIGILLLTLSFFSCAKPEPALPNEIVQKYENPTEIIKNVDFETATNWYGILNWKSPESKGPFTYKLKVWQLKVGQDNFTTIRDNQPLLVKNLNDLNTTINQQGFLEAEIEPINTFPESATYTKSVIYLIETFDVNNLRVSVANSYRYSRSNKQKG